MGVPHQQNQLSFLEPHPDAPSFWVNEKEILGASLDPERSPGPGQDLHLPASFAHIAIAFLGGTGSKDSGKNTSDPQKGQREREVK